MSQVTTHVLDTARGKPAEGVSVALERSSPEGWKFVGKGRTDADGRLKGLVKGGLRLPKGNYRLVFGTGFYFKAHGASAFHPIVIVTFAIRSAGEHYHVPLLISPFGYTTYRGA